MTAIRRSHQRIETLMMIYQIMKSVSVSSLCLCIFGFLFPLIVVSSGLRSENLEELSRYRLVLFVDGLSGAHQMQSKEVAYRSINISILSSSLFEIHNITEQNKKAILNLIIKDRENGPIFSPDFDAFVWLRSIARAGNQNVFEVNIFDSSRRSTDLFQFPSPFQLKIRTNRIEPISPTLLIALYKSALGKIKLDNTPREWALAAQGAARAFAELDACRPKLGGLLQIAMSGSVRWPTQTECSPKSLAPAINILFDSVDRLSTIDENSMYAMSRQLMPLAILQYERTKDIQYLGLAREISAQLSRLCDDSPYLPFCQGPLTQYNSMLVGYRLALALDDPGMLRKLLLEIDAWAERNQASKDPLVDLRAHMLKGSVLIDLGRRSGQRDIMLNGQRVLLDAATQHDDKWAQLGAASPMFLIAVILRIEELPEKLLSREMNEKRTALRGRVEEACKFHDCSAYMRDLDRLAIPTNRAEPL